MLFELAWNRESNFLRNPFWFAVALASSPKSHRFIAIAQHAAVPRLILIELRIGVSKANGMAQHIHFFRISSEESPVLIIIDAMHLCVFPEFGRIVLLRLDSHGIDKDFMVNLLAQNLLQALE